MLTKTKNNYIWIKLVFGLALLFYIYWKISHETFPGNFELAPDATILLVSFLLLMPLNWMSETWKLKVLTNEIAFKSLLLAVIAGISTGLLTPSRLGNFIGRAAVSKQETQSKIVINTLLANLAQFQASLLVGLIGLSWFWNEFEINNSVKWLIVLSSVLLSSLSLFIYFQPNRILFSFIRKRLSLQYLEAIERYNTIAIGKKVAVLLISLLRYAVFVLQFCLVLWALKVNYLDLNIIPAILLVYLITTLIPSLMLGKLFIREAAAISVFGMLGEPSAIVVLAVFIVWLINLAIPAIIGWLILLKNK